MNGWIEQKFWVSTSWADRALGSRASWIVATSVSWQAVGVGVGGNDDDNGALQPIVTKTAPGSVATTVAALVQLVEDRGMTVFATVDHSGEDSSTVNSNSANSVEPQRGSDPGAEGEISMDEATGADNQ